MGKIVLHPEYSHSNIEENVVNLEFTTDEFIYGKVM